MSLVATQETPESRSVRESCIARGGKMEVVGDGIANYCDLDGYIGLGMDIAPKSKPVNKSAPKYYRFKEPFPLMPNVSIPKGTVWFGRMTVRPHGDTSAWQLDRVANNNDGTGSVREGFGSSNEASQVSGIGQSPLEEVSEKDFLSYVNRGSSFFSQYKTYILVGCFIVVAVVGYFVYEKYFK